jgi:phage-related protein
MRSVVWVGSSKDDISALPGPVKASFGYRLRQVQQQGTPLDCRALRQFGPGVFELRESFEGNAYRVIYIVNLKNSIYVLHAFMKKSKSRAAIARADVELTEARLRRARALDEES